MLKFNDLFGIFFIFFSHILLSHGVDFRTGLTTIAPIAVNDLESIFHRCCQIGKNNSLGNNCEDNHVAPIIGIPLEQQSICISSINLCCTQSLNDVKCNEGIAVAKSGASCSNIADQSDCKSPFKYCCEACKLGIVASSLLVGCKLKAFKFSDPWSGVYESCCAMFGTAQSTTQVTLTNITQEQGNICDLLRGELCAHLCIPIGTSYRCQCREGYSLMADGKSCQLESLENRCSKFNPCDQNCFDTETSIECSCNSGYELQQDNRTCTDVDECREQIHSCDLKKETCVNSLGGYTCISLGNVTTRFSGVTDFATTTLPATTSINPRACDTGFSFNEMLNRCTDINECDYNPCGNVASCENTAGSFRCICKTGYQIDIITQTCVDVDECANKPCDSNQVCVNSVGSYRCVCGIGYHLDPITNACVDVNECQIGQHNCQESQRCDNTIGSYHCIRFTGCGTGYTLNSQSGLCEDDNECELGTDNCRQVGPDYQCRNTLGSFRCERKKCEFYRGNCTRPHVVDCPVGFEMNNRTGIFCSDINECERGLAVCSSGQQCINTYGSYKCVKPPDCKQGLKLDSTRKQCVDVDECLQQPYVCDHKCINYWGSFRCVCDIGYTLHTDNRSCIDIDECTLYNDRRLCVGTCINIPGSYRCECPQGYRIGNDGISCQDIDECLEGNRCTGTDEVCLNMRGTYRCNSVACPPNYIKESEHKNRCRKMSNYCTNSTPECLQMPMTYSFHFITFVSNIKLPASGQFDLFYMRGPSSPRSAVQFFLDIERVQAPVGVEKVNKDYFYLSQTSPNQAVVSFIRSIQGPQDIELHLRMTYLFNNIYAGQTVSKLFIFVSQYEF